MAASHRLPPTAPESFIVRIYRRDPRRGNRVAGTVELVANGSERSFANLRELQQILCGATGAPPSKLPR